MADEDAVVQENGGEPESAVENPYYLAWVDFQQALDLERELYRKLVEQVRPSYEKAKPLEYAKLTTGWQEKLKKNETVIKRMRHIASVMKKAGSRLEPVFQRPDVEAVIAAFARIEKERKQHEQEAVDEFGAPRRAPHGPTYFGLVDRFFGKGSIRFFERVYRPFAKNPYHKPGQAEAEYGLAMAHFTHGGKDKTVRTMLSSATTKHPIATAQMMVREGEYQREVGMQSKKGKEAIHARKAVAAFLEGMNEMQTAEAAILGIEGVFHDAMTPETQRWAQQEYPREARVELIDRAIEVDPRSAALLQAKAAILKSQGDERGAGYHTCAATLLEWVIRALDRLKKA